MQSLLKEAGFLAETDKMILKFLWKFKESRIAKQSQKKKKKNKTGGLTLPDFQIHYKATVIKTVWYCIMIHTLGNGTV